MDVFNTRALDKLVHTYRLPSHWRFSADSIDMDNPETYETHASADFLNAQEHPGTPPHKLHLVPGALYELMRNFSSSDRLMNHSMVLLMEVHDYHVLIETLDERKFPLPRIVFRWPLAKGTATMSRRQYPLRPAYASTYNGSQGCTFQRAVLDVRQSPFTHGHLYVAASRVRHRDHLRLLPHRPEEQDRRPILVKNIVWPELLSSPSRLGAVLSKKPAGKHVSCSKRRRVSVAI